MRRPSSEDARLQAHLSCHNLHPLSITPLNVSKHVMHRKVSSIDTLELSVMLWQTEKRAETMWSESGMANIKNIKRKLSGPDFHEPKATFCPWRGTSRIILAARSLNSYPYSYMLAIYTYINNSINISTCSNNGTALNGCSCFFWIFEFIFWICDGFTWLTR